MSQQFINREKELRFLETSYKSKKSEFIIIYGRRRVGKSELVLRFIKNKKSIYFLSSTEGDRENIKAMQEKIAETLQDKIFLEMGFNNWQTLFSSFVSHKNFKKLVKKKFILVIDEFPFLIHTNNAIPSIFQKIWEGVLKKENIMLILTGSAISTMEHKVLEYKSPLYGRRTGQWFLEPLDILFLQRFFPDYTIEDIINIWFVIGGIPAYLLKLSKEANFWNNVKNNIIKKGCYLYSEVEILLRDEFKEPRNYKLILKAISLGYERAGKICDYLGIDKSMLSKYLEVLKDVGIVKELSPATASKKFKGKLYRINDPYFNFWFRYVYPNRIDLEAYREDEILIKIKQDFSNYAGKMFETLIEELIRKKYFFSDFSFTKIGKQWGKFKGEKGKNTYEIDIVALNEQKKEILFAECKWQNNVNAEKILNELKEKSKYVDWPKGSEGLIRAGKAPLLRKEYFAIFAKSFKKKTKDCYCFDLRDVNKVFKQQNSTYAGH